MSVQAASPRSDTGPWLWPLAVGALAGSLAVPLAALTWAWIGFLFAAVVCAAVWIVVRDKERLLTGLFVLGLQAGASYRFLYDRAGSEGIAFPFSVLVGVALAAWWYARGTLEARAPEQSRLRLPALVVLATSAVSLLTTDEVFVGIAHLLFELELFFIYWMALRLVRSHEDLERVVQLLLVTLCIQSVIYALQSYSGLTFTLEGDVSELDAIPRPGGTVSTNPAGFASFVIPLLMIAIARFVDFKRRGKAVPLAAAILLGVMAVGLTVTRVAWVGLAAATAWVFVLSFRRGALRPGLGLGVGGIALAAGLLLAPLMAERLLESPVDDAYEERAGLMRIAVAVIATHPITGVGTGAYSQRFKEYIPGDLPEQWLYTVHNEYLLRTAETGIPGGVAYVWLLLTGFFVAQRLTRARAFGLRTLGLGWSAGLLALFWQMYWVPWRGFEFNALLWFLFGVSDAALALGERETQGAASIEISRGGVRP